MLLRMCSVALVLRYTPPVLEAVFPLTVVVQRIALELSEARGVSPDRFRYEADPRREAAFEALGF